MSQDTLENFDSQQIVQDTPSEKMLPVSQVNQIVSRVRHEASEKARMKAMEELQMQQSGQPQYASPENMAYQQQPQSYGGMPNNVDEIVNSAVQRRIEEITQKAHQERLQADAERDAKEFAVKLFNSDAYTDNKQEIDKLPLNRYPEIVYMANMIDNTGDVIAEFARNPHRMSSIAHAADRDPELAFRMMNSLSQSIKNNESAKKMSLPNAPMNQLKSSPNATDSGAKTVSDWRKIYT